jgi:anti-anti-sigma regulatory factor
MGLLTMKLEGRMVGPYVGECRQAWQTMNRSLDGKHLSLDLCDVTYIDESGLELLREIYRATRATVLSDSPLTSHFAEQVTAKAKS